MSWLEGVTTAGSIIRDLAKLFTSGNTNPDGSAADNWTLVYPSTLGAISSRAVLKTTIKAQQTSSSSVFGSNPNTGLTQQDVYIEIQRPLFLLNPEISPIDAAAQTAVPNSHYIQIRMFDQWDATNNNFVQRIINSLTGEVLDFGSRVSDWVKFSWVQDWVEVSTPGQVANGSVDDVPEPVLTPMKVVGLNSASSIQYFMSVTSQRVIMILMGEPTMDFENYMSSFGYIGRVQSFTYDTVDANGGTVVNYYSNDTDGNFVLTCGASTLPLVPYDDQLGAIRDPLTNNILDVTFSQMWGKNTGNGVTDVMMYKTKSGVPFQKHHVAFTTPSDAIKEKGFNPSRYTGKYHMSPAYVVHGYDGYRGMFENVTVVDSSSIFHLDELVVNQGQPNEEVYKYFEISAPFSCFVESGNWKYGIAIKKV